MMQGDIKLPKSQLPQDEYALASFRQMIEHSPLGVIILGSDSIRYSNEKFARIIGASGKSALEGRSINEYIHPSYKKFFDDWIRNIDNTKLNSANIEMIFLKNNNDLINVEVCGSNIKGHQNAFTQLYINDITEKKRIETELKYLASGDFLGNIINDNLLKRHLANSIAFSAARNRHVAVVYLDLDHLNLVNESYGYKAGDMLQQSVTQRLKKICRPSDVIFPLGGEKFVMIFNDIENANIINDFVRTINNSLTQAFRINGNDIYTTVTAGVSMFPENGIDSETVLKNAELAHYYAKQQGKNNYRYYSASMSRHIQEKAELLYDLRQAINKQELRLFYQPIVDIRTGKIIGLEALLRWHRENIIMSPNDFLTLAEESGLISNIGEWVIEHVCNQNLIWQQNGVAPVPVSINLSTRQFHAKSGLIDIIHRALKETKLSPQLIEFEMSESVTVLDIGSDLLQELKSLGIRLIIDDFGASYFSLNELKRYFIDAIKIDSTLIKQVPEDEDKSVIVSAIIAMAHKLGVDIISEGVETEEQLQFLKNNGCYKVQGNLLSAPKTAEDLYPYLSGDKTLLTTSKDYEPGF